MNNVMTSSVKIEAFDHFRTFLKVLMVENEGNAAPFTFRSISSGKDYTVKIQKNNAGFIQVFSEAGYLQFKKIGWYFKGQIWSKPNKTEKAKPLETDFSKAVAFLLQAIEDEQFKYLFERLEVMHLGKCCRCGRALSDAQSIERGLGPTCHTYA